MLKVQAMLSIEAIKQAKKYETSQNNYKLFTLIIKCMGQLMPHNDTNTTKSQGSGKANKKTFSYS